MSASDPVRAWVGRVARRLVPDPAQLPLYGSEAWVAASDPVRLASALRAAEAWRRGSDPHVLAARLDQEIAAARAADDHDARMWRAAARHVARVGCAPSHDELAARRRGVPHGTGRYAGRAPVPAGAPLARAAGEAR